MTETAVRALEPTGLEDIHIFHGRRLRPGSQLAETARFGEDRWPLAPAVLQGQERALTLRFDTVPPLHRTVLKRFCYIALSGPLPPGEIRPSIVSVATYFYSIRSFLKWLDESHGGCEVSRVDTEILEDYQRYLLGRHRSQPRRLHLRCAVGLLWRYRHSLGPDALRLDPNSIAAWSEPYIDRRGENSTARIPEEVHSRLLVWAQRFVDDFSSDILAAAQRWEALQRRRSRSEAARTRAPRGQAQRQILDYLDDCVRTGRPLPGSGGQPSFAAIARNIGCGRKALDLQRDAISSAAEAVGVSEHAYLGLAIEGCIDAQPWLEGVSLDPIRDDSITVLTQMLQAACYVLIAFLSGMRDSEVKHLRRGCVSTERDGNGAPYRWKVSSLAFKGETEDAGVPATWVIGESAARAIDVLEKVHQYRAHGRTDWLFASIKTGQGAGLGVRGRNEAMTLAGTNLQLNRFIAWVNEYCAARGRNDSIPDVDGSPWRLTTRQFRRTLAWYIARRPGGAIAGAIAYRHHSVQMFEGYAGTSDSGFRAEVEAEEALARGEHLLAMIDKHEHASLTGPASGEAERRLSELGKQAGFGGTVTTDPRRLLRITSRHDPAVYPGKYATCVYNHAKALCRSRTGTTTDTPDLTDCKPLTCSNVALSAENRAVWQAEMDTIEADLSTQPLLPPLMVDRLEKRREQIHHFLHRHEDSQ
ncbi:UNVERIFIED_ORG: integrase [Arthrobacter sp. UYCu721]